jgi:hypothetical protein
MEPRRYECRGRMRGKDAGSARIDSDTGATEDAASRRFAAAQRPAYAVGRVT